MWLFNFVVVAQFFSSELKSVDVFSSVTMSYRGNIWSQPEHMQDVHTGPWFIFPDGWASCGVLGLNPSWTCRFSMDRTQNSGWDFSGWMFLSSRMMFFFFSIFISGSGCSITGYKWHDSFISGYVTAERLWVSDKICRNLISAWRNQRCVFCCQPAGRRLLKDGGALINSLVLLLRVPADPGRSAGWICRSFHGPLILKWVCGQGRWRCDREEGEAEHEKLLPRRLEEEDSQLNLQFISVYWA